MAVSVQERQAQLDELSKSASSDLRELWARAAATLAAGEFAPFITEAYPELVLPYTSLAAELAATWFELSDPVSDYVAFTAPPIPVERLEKSAEWALGANGEDALSRLDGSAQRAVYDGARETILANVEATNSRWVRVARPDACAFCRMLATRYSEPSMYYRSREAAVNVVGKAPSLTLGDRRRIHGGLTTRDEARARRDQVGTRRQRGSRAIGSEGYHDFCRCEPREVRDGQTYEPPDYVYQWDQEYFKAREIAGSGDPKKILAAWRGLDPSIS